MDISDLLTAFSEWHEAKAKLIACYKSCDHSPSYYCHDAARREEKAREAVGASLAAFVDERIIALGAVVKVEPD